MKKISKGKVIHFDTNLSNNFSFIENFKEKALFQKRTAKNSLS